MTEFINKPHELKPILRLQMLAIACVENGSRIIPRC